MMRIRANSNQLIFHGARVLAFVRSAPQNCMRLQLYKRGLVTLSSSPSSSSSPLFILILCEQTAGLFLQKLSLRQPKGMRATLKIADGSPASRVRGRDEIALGMRVQGKGGLWLLDDKHTEPHIRARIHIQKRMTWSNTSARILSSFRLSFSSSCNYSNPRSHEHISSSLTVSQRHIHPVVTNHPSGADIPRSGWQSTHAHKYRLMPFPTKGLGCITANGQV